jgi:hypothetical protein
VNSTKLIVTDFGSMTYLGKMMNSRVKSPYFLVQVEIFLRDVEEMIKGINMQVVELLEG